MVKPEGIGIVIAGAGLIDTLILVDETLNNSGICTSPTEPILGYRVDCGAILTSEYSKVFGVPLAIWGFIFYLTMFSLFFMYNDKRKYLGKFLLAGAVIGILASSRFVYIQLVLIEAICLYCMASAITSTLLFILMAFSYKKMI